MKEISQMINKMKDQEFLKWLKYLIYASCIIYFIMLITQKETEYEIRKGIVTGIDCSGFEIGDTLSVGGNGQLIKYSDHENYLGVVLGVNDSIEFSYYYIE